MANKSDRALTALNCGASVTLAERHCYYGTTPLEHLHVLRALLADVRKGIDSDGFIRRVQEVLPRDLNISRAGVYLYDEEAGGLLKSWLIGAPRMQKDSSQVQPISSSISGKAFSENCTVHIPDCSKSDIIPAEFVAALRLGASLAVPVPGHGGEPIGVLRLDHEKPIPFSAADIDLFESLAAILGTIITNTRIYHELKAAELRAMHAASHDPLTELSNRRLFQQRLSECLARYRRNDEIRYALLFLDLDGFKSVNDSHGHAAGDKMLVEIAQRFRRTFRSGDLIARLGGDEFGVLLEPLADAAQAMAYADRIVGSLADPIRIVGKSFRVTASLGIVLGHGGYTSPDEILHDADVAMYRAKTSGKGRWVVFSSGVDAAPFESQESEPVNR